MRSALRSEGRVPPVKLDDSARIEWRFAADDLRGLGAIVGVDLANCKTVPEPLIAALFSYLLGVKLPGRGTNYLKQEIRFLAPAAIDEPLTAVVTVTRLRPDKNLCDLETVAFNKDAQRIAEGRALVLIKDVASR